MPFHESEEIEASLSEEQTALQELAEETGSLERQRKHLDDQRALLDLAVGAQAPTRIIIQMSN